MARIKVSLFLVTILALTLGGCSAALPEGELISDVPPIQIAESTAAPTVSKLESPTSSVAAIAPPSGNLIDSSEVSSAEAHATSLPTQDVRMNPREWSAWPIIPVVSNRAKEIYHEGILAGNHANTFSVVGDCQSEPNVFLGIYETDRNPLGPDEVLLMETVDRFRGSFLNKSVAVRDGMSAPSALSPLWAEKALCEANENPIQCELRLQRPSIVFVNLGTNWKPGASADAYEKYLRELIAIIIEHGTLPILSTKADNVEGNHGINLATARVAYDYDIPMWNFWAAANVLPNHGLDSTRDNIYLTIAGWNLRSRTGLMALDHVWRSLEKIK